MNFKSLIELLDYFQDEKICIEYFARIRWGGNPVCPHCGSEKVYITKAGYKCGCKNCKKKFTVKVGTYLENSKLPLRTWFAAIYLLTTSKRGISSVQLSVQLGITQKTAWFMLHRIRQMLKDDKPKKVGGDKEVEVDETYVGGKRKNKHYGKKRSWRKPNQTNDGEPYVPKKVVIGMIERNGNVALKHIPAAKTKYMIKAIKEHVPVGSIVYTDEHKGYSKLSKNYFHETVNHSKHIYKVEFAHTNSIESFWSILKRGIIGIYYQVSSKHLHRYLDEFAGRFNTRLLHQQNRLNGCLAGANGRLRYASLIERL